MSASSTAIRRRTALLVAALSLCALAFALVPRHASAAACASDLKVAGMKVSGDDCSDNGDGSITITNPRLSDSQTVEITGVTGNGKMILSADRSKMTSSDVAIPLKVLAGSHPVMVGTVQVGSFQFCDLAPAANTIPGQDVVTNFPTAMGTTVEDYHPAEVNCRVIPAIQVTQPVLQFAAKLAGLDVDVLKQPLVLGVDDARGGRVFGTLAFKLPKLLVGERIVRVGVGAEVSSDNGLKLVSASVSLQGSVLPTVIPGVLLRDPGITIDPVNNRYAGTALVQIPGHGGIGASLGIDNGQLSQLGATVILQHTVFLPIGAPPKIGITQIGFNYKAASTTTSTSTSTGLVGGLGSQFLPPATPASLSGSVVWLYAPLGAATPASSPKLLSGDVTLTIAGPTISLSGDVFAVNTLVKLASAKLSLSTDPFRIQANANFSTPLNFLTGSIFVGAGDGPDGHGHFTALGTATAKIPNIVPVVGGQTLGGVSAVLSDAGAGAVLTVDPPFVDPFTIGAGLTWSPLNFSIIRSLTPFITFTPKVGGFLNGVTAAATRGLKVPRGVNEMLVEVAGKARAPRAVKLSPPHGSAHVANVGSVGKSTFLAVQRPPAGTWNVSSRDKIARVTANRVNPFPYLDPNPGLGTRPHGPIQAGTPAHFCWKIKNAPPTAVVDLFEDQNGRQGTGRPIATALKANACFDVPTSGLEPGRHWVYGVVRVGNQLISARYWPLAITIVDPTRLGAPAGVKVTATKDGAHVEWTQDPLAGQYVVHAVPAADRTADPVDAAVSAVPAPSADLTLRGARNWVITVQPYDLNNVAGNLSNPVAVSPTDPVVLAGQTDSVALAGQLYALKFQVSTGLKVRVVQGPRGLRIDKTGLVTWKPSAGAAKAAPQHVVIEGCSPDSRCVQRAFDLSAYGRNLAPFGPARGFEVTPNVVRARGGDTITLRAQGIDQGVKVKIDGKRVRKVHRVNASAVEVKLPKLARGPHDLGLQIGADPEEVRLNVLVAR